MHKEEPSCDGGADRRRAAGGAGHAPPGGAPQRGGDTGEHEHPAWHKHPAWVTGLVLRVHVGTLTFLARPTAPRDAVNVSPLQRCLPCPSVRCQGVYENQEHVYIVMEQCTGGELFDAIVSNGRYAESHAAALIRTIVGVVAHCHNMNVIHRVGSGAFAWLR